MNETLILERHEAEVKGGAHSFFHNKNRPCLTSRGGRLHRLSSWEEDHG